MSNHFKLMGEFYGYPECCIEAMVEYNAQIGPTYGNSMIQKHGHTSPFLGTGYIPCNSCWYKPTDDIIQTINKRRYYKLNPFPSKKQYGMGDELFLEFKRSKNHG